MTSIFLHLVNAMFIAVPIVFCLALFSLVMLCINWKTEYRKKHAARLGLSLASVPLIAGAIYVTSWFVLMPLMAAEQTKQNDAAAAKRFSDTTLVEVGDRSPDFTLKTLSGESFTSPQRGKVVVVTFFATWCGPCLIELPHIQRIWESRNSDERLRMFVVSREESENDVTEFLNANGYTFPAAADTEREIYSQFASESIPRTFVIAPDGTIAHATIGFADGDQIELEKVLDDLLDELPDAR